MEEAIRILFVEPCARDMKLVAAILLKMTEQLPGQYLFDVVTNNFAALELVSRKVYGSVWVAEEKGSSLDGRTAAAILRESCPGLVVILLLDDVEEHMNSVKKEISSPGHETLGSGPLGKRVSLRQRAQVGMGKGSAASQRSGIFHQAMLSRLGAGSWARLGMSGNVRSSSVWQENAILMDLVTVDYVLKKPFSEESFRLLLGAVQAEHSQVQAKVENRTGAGATPAATGDTAITAANPAATVDAGGGEHEPGADPAASPESSEPGKRKEVGTPSAETETETDEGSTPNTASAEAETTRKVASAMLAPEQRAGEDKGKTDSDPLSGGHGSFPLPAPDGGRLCPRTPSSSGEPWLLSDRLAGAEDEAKKEEEEAKKDRGKRNNKSEGKGGLPTLPEPPLLPPPPVVSPKKRPPRAPGAARPLARVRSVAPNISASNPPPPLSQETLFPPQKKQSSVGAMPGLPPPVPIAFSGADSFGGPIHVTSWARGPTWYNHPAMVTAAEHQHQQSPLAQSPDRFPFAMSRRSDRVGGSSVVRQWPPGSFHFQEGREVPRSPVSRPGRQPAVKRARLQPSLFISARAASAALPPPHSLGFLSTPPARVPAHFTRGSVNAGRSRKVPALLFSTGATGADAAAGTGLALGASMPSLSWMSPTLHDPVIHDEVSRSTDCDASRPYSDPRAEATVATGAASSPFLHRSPSRASEEAAFQAAAATLSGVVVTPRSVSAPPAGGVGSVSAAHREVDSTRASAVGGSLALYELGGAGLDTDAWPVPSALGRDGGGVTSAYHASTSTPPRGRGSLMKEESPMRTPEPQSSASLVDRESSTQSPLVGCDAMRA